MAISEVHFDLLCELRRRGVVGGQRLLELGEANLYGDMHPQRIIDAIEEFRPGEDDLCGNKTSIREIIACGKPSQLHLKRLARQIYYAMGIRWEGSIDSGGDCYKFDLNEPINLNRRFSLLYNHGTAEHIFNVANVFKIAHDHCEPGGLIIHELPWTGWIDHGFYSLQPTLFYDLALANCYRIELFAAMELKSKKVIRFECREDVSRKVRNGEIGGNLNLFVCFRKMFDAEFRIPQQGVYSGKVSNEVSEAWTDLR
jgi:hypothetical protein